MNGKTHEIVLLHPFCICLLMRHPRAYIMMILF